MDTTAANACHSRFGNTITRLAVGFTLVELLVVVAVMALLTGLLLPALTKAKQSASSVQCKSNLRQLQFAAEMYSNDNEGYFPPNREATPFGYWQSVDGSWVLGNAKRDRDAKNLRKGVLWGYNGAAGIYRCPADQSTILGRPELRRLRSYAWNGFLNPGFMPGENAVEHLASYRKDSQVAAPTRLFGFICVNEGSIDAGTFALAVEGAASQTFSWWNTPAERHDRGANLSFLDGSMTHRRWLFTPKRFVIEGPHRAVNEADRNDMLWLLERTPYWFWDKRTGPKL